jgi:hypothetical protein
MLDGRIWFATENIPNKYDLDIRLLLVKVTVALFFW